MHSSRESKSRPVVTHEMMIRQYSDQQDRDAVVRLWQQVFGYASAHNAPAFAIDQKIAVKDGLFFVATADGAVIGTIMAGYDGHRGWIYSLAVKSESRGRGIGTALLRYAEAALRERGCPKINLQINDTNAGVVAFYEKLGYVVEPRISMGKKLKQ
jgi:ribosomal protein S18 acetylase RimI-like enzyme